MTCAVCRFNVRSPKNIYTENLADTNIPIFSAIEDITSGTNFVLSDNSSICKRCYEKLSRYQKALQNAQKIRDELFKLISCTLTAEDGTQDNFVQFGNEYLENSECAFTELAQMNENEIETKDENSQIEFLNDEFIQEDYGESAIIVYEDQFNENGSNLSANVENDEDLIEEVSESQYGHEEFIIEDDQDTDDKSKNDIKKGILGIRCEKCGHCFENKRQLKAHNKRDHFKGYVCDTCGKILQSYSGFVGHVKNHSGDKEFECKECGERFNRRFRLKHHMAWHTGEKPFQCDVCQKRFVHRIALYKHKLIHREDTRRFKCTECNFKFRTMAHLKRHLRTHTGDKPYECPVCKKSFSQLYNMKSHLRDHEKPGSNRPRRYPCDQCNHTFASKKIFDCHIDRNECQQLMKSRTNSIDLPNSTLIGDKKVLMLSNEQYT